MASKKAATTALQTLTNIGGKRKGADDESASKKKLKSHDRTMSTEKAKRVLADTESKLKVQNKIIRDKQKEIRELKKQLQAAEDCVTKAKRAKARLESQNTQAVSMVNSDSDLIFQKVEAEKTSTYSYDVGGTCRNAMEDMILLGDEANILRLAVCIRDLGKGAALKVALVPLLATLKEQQQPSVDLIKALRELYLPLLRGAEKINDCKIWPLVASAINFASNDQTGGFDAIICAEDYMLLSERVFVAAKEMKEANPVSYVRYNASEGNCPIIDVLLPAYKAITGGDIGSAAKANLLQVIKTYLLESISEPIEGPVTHAMPEEAEIAGKNGFPDVQSFLLSPSETTLRLNLSKAGRMSVHRLIDYKMGYGKLDHSSEGSGRGRVLVLRKTTGEQLEIMNKKKERKQKHTEMLYILFSLTPHMVCISLPPPDTKLGISIGYNSTQSMPELKNVADNSPIRTHFPQNLTKNCCIVSFKSEVMGQVQPKTVEECVSYITKLHGETTAIQDGGNKLEMVLLPLKEEASTSV